ncbi:hypothetical protein CsatB_029677 [Cannabis sativa]|uniref:uncharacterized protein LOC133034470 n=1 Tax=Cannabis sativa TaxID=3483 RepID=UPI0029CA66BB|nr:uncharacterized protein LOC133034470 [Cannabis sativa]
MGGPPKPGYLIKNFRKALDACKLWEIVFEGSDYTWCNGRKNNLIFERLDRVCGNSNWFDMFPFAQVSHLERTNSDHCPLLLTASGSSPMTTNKIRWGTQFHFESAWADDEDCTRIVNSAWQHNNPIMTTRELKDKLGRCGEALQKWNRVKWKEMTKQLNEYADKI